MASARAARLGLEQATVGADKSVRIWDLATRECVRILTGHTDVVHRVAFRPDGTLLATTGRDSTVRIWTERG